MEILNGNIKHYMPIEADLGFLLEGIRDYAQRCAGDFAGDKKFLYFSSDFDGFFFLSMRAFGNMSTDFLYLVPFSSQKGSK